MELFHHGQPRRQLPTAPVLISTRTLVRGTSDDRAARFGSPLSPCTLLDMLAACDWSLPNGRLSSLGSQRTVVFFLCLYPGGSFWVSFLVLFIPVLKHQNASAGNAWHFKGLLRNILYKKIIHLTPDSTTENSGENPFKISLYLFIIRWQFFEASKKEVDLPPQSFYLRENFEMFSSSSWNII